MNSFTLLLIPFIIVLALYTVVFCTFGVKFVKTKNDKESKAIAKKQLTNIFLGWMIVLFAFGLLFLMKDQIINSL